MTRQKLFKLVWEVLIHLSFHQILHLQMSVYFGLYKILLNGKIFNSLEDYKKHLEQFFAQKEKKLCEDRIMKLPEKWQKILEQNIEYIVE